jgi:hypothetical protein
MRRRILCIGAAIGTVLVLAGCVGGPPSPSAVASEFATPIEPAWEVDVPGIFGEPTVVDDVVLIYATDDEVGMRLSAFALDTGELLWEHVASPGGAHAYSILSSGDAADRTYPLPAIQPFVVDVGTGDDAAPAVVFFERDIPETDSIRPDDLLRVADIHTGDLHDVTLPDVDPEEFTFEPLGFLGDEPGGDVFANVYSPPYRCGDDVCWVSEDADAPYGYASITLDPEKLEARYRGGLIAETGETITPDWGTEYVRISEDGIEIARIVDGAIQWRADVADLFAVDRTSPPDFIDFVTVGDLVLIQGYQPILETLDPDLPHTLQLDATSSRTLVAVDRETGEVAWRLPGGDMLCHAVHGYPIEPDAESIPICLATAGGFVFDLTSEEMVEQEDIVASIAEVDVASGEIGWELPGLGTDSIAQVVRLVEVAYGSRGPLTVAGDKDDVSLVDLRDGEAYPMPENAGYVCRSERDDVLPEFEGSTFTGGINPIATGYPAGWYQFPCDEKGSPADSWTRGSVRVAGYGASNDSTMVVLPLEGLLAGFKL